MPDNDKIRVLIVDDIAETRENIRKLLQFDSEFEVAGSARSGKEAIELSKELKPDVVLMDINMPDMDGITATEMIRRNNSFSQVVILSVQGDPNYMRRAMLAGARDFLTKPPVVDELTAAIRRAGKMARDEKQKGTPLTQSGGPGASPMAGAAVSYGKVILVYSPKGGTGSTTVAINLGMTLNAEETPVALVDGNLEFGDMAVFLNLQGKLTIVDLASRAEELDPEIVDEVMIDHNASGIKILACPPRPEYAESVNGDQFGKVLDYLRRFYSYIVVDAASSLTDVTLAALDAADIILLITTQDIPSVKNARLFLDLVDVLKINRQRIVFVMNKFDKRIGITPDKISENFKQEILAVIPADERVVIPSVNRGVPFMLGDRSKPIARSFLSLAEVIRQRLAENSNVEEEKAAVATTRFGKR
ncbi:MAG: response regulator [Anaerolineales bacterium]|jgi:pilus assembly protein CpaE